MLTLACCSHNQDSARVAAQDSFMMSSSDEGEIIETKGGDLKASSLARTKGNSVDRRDRPHSRDSPDRDPRKSRSPRGYKRGHDDYDAGTKRRHAPGQSRSDHGGRDDHKRSRVAYDDLDRSSGRDNDREFPSRSRRDDDRDRSYAQHGRHRSRSPPYRSRHDDRGSSGRNDRNGHRDSPARRSNGLDYDDHRDANRASAGSRQSMGRPQPPAGNGDAKSLQDSSKSGHAETAAKSVHFAEFDSSGALTSSSEPATAEPDIDYDNAEQFDEEAEIERRRKRREALLAKSSSATPLLLHAVGATEKIRAASPAGSDGTLDSETPQTPQTPQSSKFYSTLRKCRTIANV